jgi:PAS domain S-box-containing protein
MRNPSFQLLRYGAAVGVLIVAVLMHRVFFPDLGDRYPLLTYFSAVVLIAWYGGLGPSLLTLAASTVLAARALFSLDGSIWLLDTTNWQALGLFVVLGLGVIAQAERFRMSRAQVEAIVDGTSDAVVLIDKQRRIVRVNPAFTRLFGYTPQEASGRTGEFLCASPADCPSGSDAPSAASRTETQYRRKDGSLFWSESLAVRLKDASGSLIGAVGIHRDISERKRTEEALRRGAEEIATLLELLPVAVLIAQDPECRVITGNRAAHTLLRVPLAGNISSSAPAPEAPRHYKLCHEGRELAPEELPIQRAATLEERVEVDLDVVFDEGSTVHLGGTAAPLYGEEGRVRGAVGVFLDLTERKRMEESLKATDRRKDEFLAMLAHELRNPLTPISNALQLLRRTTAAAGSADAALGIAERQLGHLVRLVDDLLDVSRISHGKITLRKEPSTLRAIVQAALETSRPEIEAAGHGLTVDLPAESAWLEVDPVRIAQALSNLLINAAKYTGRGGSIGLSGRCEGREVAIVVQDTGMGIPETLLPDLFEPFAQAGHQPHQVGRGLGVGLPLAKSLVELHGGRLEAASAGPGRGSTFTLHLPLAEAGTPGAAVATEVPRASPHTRRILVVDDDEDVADSTAMLLETLGYEVITVYDGAAALEAARAQRPEVVLLDIGMPGMDGYEVARRLRGEPAVQGAALIAVTGWGQEADRRCSREAGFDRHLVKPVELGALEAALEAGTEPATAAS